MKKLLIYIFIIIGLKGFSQVTYTPMIASGYQFKYVKHDSGFALPLIDTSIGRGINRPGLIVTRSADSLPYYYDGRKWRLLGAQFANALFDSTTIYNILSQKLNIVDTVGLWQAQGIYLTNFTRLTDSTVRYTFNFGDAYIDDTSRIELTQENITNITNIFNYLDSLNGEDTTFIRGPTSNGFLFAYSTTDALSDNDTLHFYFPPNNISGDSMLVTDVDGNLKQRLIPAVGGGGTVTSVTGSAPIVITSTPTLTPNVTIDTSTVGTGVTTLYRNSLKQNLVTLTTTGTSGASTFNQSTGALNVPQYAGTVTGGVINWPAVIYSTPTTGTVSSGTLTFAPALASQAAHTFLGNSTGSSAAPTFVKVDLAADVTGVLPIANGGTNISTYTAGDILYASATNVLSKLPIGTTRQKLGIVAGVPAWMDSTAVSASAGWSTIGNAGIDPTLNFLGTTDSKSLRIRTNNNPVAIFDSVGNVGIGTLNESPNSRFTVRYDGVGAVTTTYATDSMKGISLVNNTAATAGQTQYSPVLRFRGSGWKTNATAASQPTEWRIYNLTGSAAAAPGSFLQFDASINGATWTTPLSLSSAGVLTTAGAISALTGNISGNANIIASGSSAFLQTTRNVVTTSADGLLLNPQAAATSGVPVQYSPRVRMTSNAWNGSANEFDGFTMEVRGVSGTTPTTSNLVFSSSIGTSSNFSGTDIFTISNFGKPTFYGTNTTVGTTGAQTINRPSGTVNFAAAATTLVVTNSLVTTSSIVFAEVRTNDATAYIKNVIPATGSFTITLGAAATAETSVGWLVIN